MMLENIKKTPVRMIPLKDLGFFIRGNGLQKKDLVDSGFPAIHYGQIHTKYHVFSDETLSFVSDDLADRLKKARRNDLLLATTSENDEDVVKPLAWLGGDLAISGDMMIFRHNQNVKYLAYFFLTEHFSCQKYRLITGTKVRRVSASDLGGIMVPIPFPDDPEKSLKIQAEMVRILDAFTALTSELTSELTTRKNQYRFYREKLLDFNNFDVVWTSLGDVSTIQRGASPRPIFNYITDDEDGVPWIKIGDTFPGSKYVLKTAQKIKKEGAEKSRLLKRGDFILSNSMSFGRPYILGISGAIHDGWASLSGFQESLDSDFLYHYLSSDGVLDYWEKKINSSSVSNLNTEIIKSLPVPLVSMDRQKQIASLLDKFDVLTQSITEGLPREIELRRKQYEYYRDFLFGFLKNKADA